MVRYPDIATPNGSAAFSMSRSHSWQGANRASATCIQLVSSTVTSTVTNSLAIFCSVDAFHWFLQTQRLCLTALVSRFIVPAILRSRKVAGVLSLEYQGKGDHHGSGA